MSDNYYDIGLQAAHDFAQAVNGFGDGQKGFVDGFFKAHPTLQQSMFEAFLNICKEMAKKDDWDDRTKASVHVAKKIMATLDNQTQLPLV